MIEWFNNQVWHHVSPCRKYGIDIGQRMTVVRLENQSLLVHNPAPLSDSLIKELKDLGTVSCITTVNQGLHDDLSDWWLAYPGAYFFAAPGLDGKRTDIGFDGILNSATAPYWKGQLFQSVIRGSHTNEEVVFCEPRSRTLFIGESLLLLSQGSTCRRLTGMLTGCAQDPIVPLSFRWKCNDKKLLRHSLQEVLTWPFDNILPVHGDPIEQNGKRILADAFHWALSG